MALRCKTATLTLIVGMLATAGGPASADPAEPRYDADEKIAVRSVGSGGVVVPFESRSPRNTSQQDDTTLPPAA